MLLSKMLTLLLALLLMQTSLAQDIIPMDTSNWSISPGANYLFENFQGKDAIYLQGGAITHKTAKFKNGTIEFDVYLKNEQAFPGVSFRIVDNDAEKFYIRPHQSGNPDGNQVIPMTKGITPWQLYFGPKYSFIYNYAYDRWTHVKIVVNDNRGQIFLDNSPTPHLSWNLFHPTRAGGVSLNGGNRTAMHIADVKIDHQTPMLKNFAPIARPAIEGLIEEWEISDMFERKLLNDPGNLSKVISQRSWGRKIQVEEGTAANISRKQFLRNGAPGETVFAKIKINSASDQIKLFQFGYSDAVIAILNGQPIYQGTNRFRTRDYRYLGTVGLFDAIFLNLRKGENTLLMAVSENFGGWLITGKFANESGIEIVAND